MSDAIESAIEEDDWSTARALIEEGLLADPKNHWLVTRLGLTYYEEHNYELALRYSLTALKIAPTCPLATWDCAGAFDMLNRYSEAIPHYQRMIDAGDQAIAFGDCGEGIEWARCLIADCHFRIADCFRKTNEPVQAIANYECYFKLRKLGWESIYDESIAREHLENFSV
jgi:Tfp pilus assembly protein PilF